MLTTVENKTVGKKISEISGTIFDIQRFSLQDGPGIRTTIFLKGCPLSCLWCHNPEGIDQKSELFFSEKYCIGCGKCVGICSNGVHLLMNGKRQIRRELCNDCGKCILECPTKALQLCGKKVVVSQILKECDRDCNFYGHSGGVTLSGGEPLLQPEFTLEILQGCKQRGYHTVIETCGAVRWKIFKKILNYTDLIIYDIKHINSIKHKKFTGVLNKMILDNLCNIIKTKMPVNIRLPIIPTYNDSKTNLKQIAKFLRGIGIHSVELLPYNNLARSKWDALNKVYLLQELIQPSARDMQAIQKLMKSEGIITYFHNIGSSYQSDIDLKKGDHPIYISTRIKRLREKFVSDHKMITPEWTILMSQSLKRTEGKSMVARRAEAFSYVLQNLPIEIDCNELIVGRFLKRVPTTEDEKLLKEAESYLSQSELNILPLGHSDVLLDRFLKKISTTKHPHFERFIKYGLFTVYPQYHHIAPNAEKLLKEGWEGIVKGIQKKLKDKNLNSDKKIFLQSSLRTVKAAMNFIMRYSMLAKEKSYREKNIRRREELQTIQGVCLKIATKPPVTFYEAIQLIWFQYFLVNLEICDKYHALSLGQLDRLLIGFYRQDLDAGRITYPKATQLIQHLFLGMNIPEPREHILPVMVGGIKHGGQDASNELTDICLEAAKALHLLNPSIAFRYHKKISPPLLKKAITMWGTGSGYPQIFNDELCIPSLVHSGIREEDASEWTHSVCTELTVVGKTNAWISSPYLNMVKPLELVLNGGRSLITGERLSMIKKTLVQYRSFTELYNAYLKEISKWIGISVSIHNRVETIFKKALPQPFLSASVDDCIQKAKDYTDGGPRYNPSYIQGIGISTVVDSLIVLKKLLYSQGKISADRMLDSLRKNFEGYSTLRHLVSNYRFKYGNDIDEVDSLFADIAKFFCNEVRRYRNTRGGHYYPGFMVWKSHQILGENTGATPDGRYSGTALSDSVGSVQGRDETGLTALLKSVTQTDFIPAVGGVTFNVRLMPSLFDSDEIIEKIINSVKVYFNRGGFHIQANVVDGSVLRDAQLHPDRYRNLMVRVAGFSAYFTTLSYGIQSEIISRTEHGNNNRDV